jgi:indolepyruvate ferredoxin oxidoreductase alpha subunit
MKQVGLNVASDPLMSVAYTGVVGGLVVVAADDPGPHSSQTEQDTRLFGLFSKVPVLDPGSPAEALEMARAAFEISERHRVPVLLRPTTRICHGKQNVAFGEVEALDRPFKFVKEPTRWAATPVHRLRLHKELNEKLAAIEEEFEASPLNVRHGPKGRAPLGIVGGGVALETARELLDEWGLANEVPVLKIGTPFPLPRKMVGDLSERCERLLASGCSSSRSRTWRSRSSSTTGAT